MARRFITLIQRERSGSELYVISGIVHTNFDNAAAEAKEWAKKQSSEGRPAYVAELQMETHLEQAPPPPPQVYLRPINALHSQLYVQA